MASYTTNLNLKKPSGSENVSIGDINNNMDTIDQAYGNMKDFVKSKAFTASESPFTINFPTNSRHLIILAGSNAARSGAYIIRCATDGTMTVAAISSGSAITYDESVSNKVTFTFTGSVSMAIVDIVAMGNVVSI